MVMVNLMCASVMEGTREHARTYVYVTDDGEESEQGTLRDNNRGKELAQLIVNGSRCVAGEPPEGSRKIALVYLAVVDARGMKASHALGIRRLDFRGESYDAWCKMQATKRNLEDILRKAARQRDIEKAQKEAAKQAKREGEVAQ